MKILKQLCILLIAMILMLFSLTASSQVTMEPKTTILNVGLGFQGNRFHTSTWHPSINAVAKYAIVKNTTIGVEGNYFGKATGKDSRFTSYSIGISGDYYLNSLLNRADKKNNYYTGLGVMFYQFKYSDFSAAKGKIYIPIHIGVRRLVYKDYGANVQLAFNDVGFIKVGVFKKL